VLIGGADFGGDEERGHDEFTVGDDLGIVRFGSDGALALREVKGDVVGPWRKLATNIGEDDAVAVDGDDDAVVVVTTREVPDACVDGGPAPQSVHAVRVNRASRAETRHELAPAECGKELGPFWTGSLGARLVIAWSERVPRQGATSAPIAGLTFRTFLGATLSPIGRVPLPSDALVFAGCDDSGRLSARCYAVALARAPGTTDMLPEVAQLIAYP